MGHTFDLMHESDFMSDQDISTKLKNLPTVCGVYLFKNHRGKVIYIGKAKNLRSRVRSYFQKDRREGAKLTALVRRIDDFEWIVTDSESEAFILEANLVKEFHPRYNINLKDDKSFPYIRVTNEEFPRIFPTRKIIRDGSRYFGPYTDVYSMRSLLKAVRKIFPIRSCNYRLDEETVRNRKVKLCLDYHINRCLGPCEELISEDDYKKIVTQTVSFIEGREENVVQQLMHDMERSAELQQFERAARIRDRIQAIEVFRSKQKVVSDDKIDRDVLGIYSEDSQACAVVFKVREGKITGRNHFFLSRNLLQSEPEILQAFLQQYYIKVDFMPREILIPYEIERPEEYVEWLSRKRNGAIGLIRPKIGSKAKLVRLATRNAKLLLQEKQLQRMKDRQERISAPVAALQEALSLPGLPRRIEAFDISNISGSDPVASMVCFVDGKPSKSDYRHFKIRTISGIDDFAMMKEVVHRRYSRVVREKKPFPDLILIDGGKGQLSSAVSVLEELAIESQPIISLAKKLEEVFVPDFPEPQNIPKDSPCLKLLKQIRDESHRFAVTFHRKLRGKRQIRSSLDEIPGVGPQRRKRLIAHFGTLRNLEAADLNAIKSVQGIPGPLAERLYDHLRKVGSGG